MVKKVRARQAALSGAAIGSMATGAVTITLATLPLPAGIDTATHIGTGAAGVAAMIWLVARLANELFWAWALSKPAAAAEKITRGNVPNQKSIQVLQLVLDAQNQVVRARSGSQARSQ